MGEVIEIDSNRILPSQDFVKEDTSKFILFEYFRGKIPKIPIPVVRFSEDKKNYIVIDGHNLLVVWDFLKIKCKVYVANNKEDFITKEDFPDSSLDSINQRNKDLMQKYDLSLKESENVQKNGIKSIKDLRIKGKILYPPKPNI